MIFVNQIKILIRSNINTLLYIILFFIVSFIIYYRVSEYVITSYEFIKMAESYRGVGLVELSKAEYFDISTPLYVTDTWYNPDNTSGTWEDTRYEALTFDIINTISDLPYVNGISIRYMTAGISELYERYNKSKWFAYSDRYVYEGKLYNYGCSIIENSYIIIDDARLISLTLWEHNALTESINDMGIGNLEFYFFTHGNPPAETIFKRDSKYAAWLGENKNSFWMQRNKMYNYGNRVSIITSSLYDSDYVINIKEGRYVIILSNSFFGDHRAILGNHWYFYLWDLGDSVIEYFSDLIIPLEGKPDNYLETNEFDDLKLLINMINSDKYTLDVVYTEDMNNIFRFNEGDMAISEGFMLTPKDIGTNKCVINYNFAIMNELKVGDFISINLCDKLFDQHAGLGAVAYTRERYAEPVKSVELEIIGLYVDLDINTKREDNPYWSYSDNTIFVPFSLLPESADIISSSIKPGAFSFTVNALNINEFLQNTAPQIEKMGLMLYFSDGGWLTIDKQYKEARKNSFIALFVLITTACGAIMLAAYLFILQNRKEYAIMRALGCKRINAEAALILPLFLINIIGITMGIIAVYLLTPNKPDMFALILCIIFELLFLCFAAFLMLRYTNILSPLAIFQKNNKKIKKSLKNQYLVNLQDEYEYKSLVSTSISRSKEAPLPSVNQTASFIQIIRYVIRNIIRTWLKTIMVLIVTALLFIAMGQFAVLRITAYELYESIPVKAVFSGKLRLSYAKRIRDSGYVKDSYLEYNENVLSIGDYIYDLVVTNNIEKYFGTNDVLIEYITGYGPEDMFNWDTDKEMVCVLSEEIIQNVNTPSETIELTFEHDGRIVSQEFKIIGTIKSSDENVVLNVALIPSEKPFYVSYGQSAYYQKAEFTLVNNHEADNFSYFLEKNILPLLDKNTVFIMNTDDLTRIGKNIELYDMLLPVCMITFVLVGSLFPGLMILQTKKEASLLRMLGTSKKRTFTLLFIQHISTFVTGLILGAVVLCLLNDAGNITAIIDTLLLYAELNFIIVIIIMIVFYKIINKKNLLDILQVKE